MTETGFQQLRSAEITSLGVEVNEYRHQGTGARHFHLAAGDDNNAFLVAFLTVPQDSTGVAHILEHTTLCGSQRFPVRDPFFMMTRRSLNTFMNAFTSSDWTAYPFASQNRKDYYNLLQVYLDCVFFPRLDELDFAQEGHRIEFQDPEDPASPLEFKGVVFNEMKGAMSSPISQVWHALQSRIFPTTTYHFNSGGEPESIPDLTYQQLKAFHARHYHPSNAIFMTYGNLPPEEHQRFIHDCALKRFRSEDLNLAVPDERRFQAPQAAVEYYALEDETDTRNKTHVVLGWLLGRIPDVREALTCHLLSGVLLDNSSSPLRHALETSDLGTSPSELCGVDDSTREMTFVCGLEGSEPARAGAVEKLILETLEDVAANGVALEQLEAVLHQLELSQREIHSGGFPYGLRLMVNTLAPTLHGGDPVAVLDIDPILSELRQNIQNPEFIKNLVREKLLHNAHRVRLTMAPDPGLSDRKREQERVRLNALNAELDETHRQAIIERARALAERQMREDDPEILPRVGLEDVPTDRAIAQGETSLLAGMEASWFAAATNGMVYQQIVVDIPELDEELIDTLPLYCECIGEVGSAGRDYRTTQARQAAVTGGIGGRCTLSGGADDVTTTRDLFVLSGKALARNHGALTELLRETWNSARFDELKKLRELVSESRAQREMGVTQQGHVLAMLAASAGLSPVAALTQRWDGLQGLQWLKRLDADLSKDGELESFADRLTRLGKRLDTTARRMLLLVAEADLRAPIEAAVAATWRAGVEATDDALFAPAPAAGIVRQGWATSTQVNFAAKAYPTVSQGHPDAAPLTVLGPLLRNGFLHRAIREQGGAYGAGAGYDSDSGAFRFFSYRDPRLAETLEDFDRSVEWLKREKHAFRVVEEAILGVIGSIDRPNSPAGEAVSAYFAELHGRTPERRRLFRRRVLDVTIDDLRRVAEQYLVPERASIAVVSDAKTLDQNAGLGLDIIRV